MNTSFIKNRHDCLQCYRNFLSDMSLEVNISEPDEFNCKQLHNYIQEIAKLKGIDDYSYHVDFLCEYRENFIANVFRVIIKDTDDEDNNVSVIVKTLINTTRQEMFHELHCREVDAYTRVIEKFKEIQNPRSNERLTLPECLLTISEKGNEVIILGDLNRSGFESDKTLSNYGRLDFSRVSTVLKNLAKFHGISLIYENHDPKSFAQVKTEFADILFSNSFLNKSKLRNYFQESFGMSVSLIDDFEAKKKLEQVETKLLEILRYYVRPRNKSVLCHGDCWLNNMLFKTKDDEETEVCFIDFQAMRYASPATDIHHFLYLCTDSGFRKTHKDDLLDIYYNSLKSFLNLYDCDINLVYTREEFDCDIETAMPFGLLIALIELKLITTSPEDEVLEKGYNNIPSISNADAQGNTTDSYYKIMVNDVVNESVGNGVLEQLVQIINKIS